MLMTISKPHAQDTASCLACNLGTQDNSSVVTLVESAPIYLPSSYFWDIHGATCPSAVSRARATSGYRNIDVVHIASLYLLMFMEIICIFKTV
jgi:hypothetical protein